MVFCQQNCSDLIWEKNCSSDREKLLKFEAEGWEFASSTLLTVEAPTPKASTSVRDVTVNCSELSLLE